jgi:hypothetical protein
VTLAGATAVESTDTTILFTAGVASVTVAGQGHTHAPGTLNSPTHTHTVTSANSPIALPGDPVASFPVILCYRQ